MLWFDHKFIYYFIGFAMKKSVISALGSLAFAVLVLGFSVHIAAAQDASSSPLPAASPTGWGSGPIMASLIGSVRREAPIRGIEPATPTSVAPVQDARSLPEKAPERLPSVLSVEAMEQSIATAKSTDFAAKAIRQVAQSR
jgi:hypothetical protein